MTHTHRWLKGAAAAAATLFVASCYYDPYGGGGYGGGGYGGGGYYGGGMSTTTTSTIYIGSVVLDMYDAASKNLVWRSLASKQIDTKAKPEKREKNLNKGAQKMLKDFPPKKKTT